MRTQKMFTICNITTVVRFEKISFVKNHADDFLNIINTFNEGLIIINNSRDKVIDTNEAAQKIFFAGLSGMCKIRDADLEKKKF